MQIRILKDYWEIKERLIKEGWRVNSDYASLEINTLLDLTHNLNKLIGWGIFTVMIVGMDYRQGRYA